jgi:hypothetical protein
MLAEKPKWIFVSKKPVAQWYNHVHLLPNHVLGQWVCLARGTGELLWQRSLLRPNTICGVDSGVIVGSEMRSDGPWTFDFGCYGISLTDGRLLWTSHASGVWGPLLRLFDFVPSFTNEFRDTPHHVKDGRVFCNSGRVLDVLTGRTLERIDPQTIYATSSAERTAEDCDESKTPYERNVFPIGNGLSLSRPSIEDQRTPEAWEVVAESEDGNELWRLPIRQLTPQKDGCYFGERLSMPFLYLTVSEGRFNKPHPKHPNQSVLVVPNPVPWRLFTIDARDGSVLQDLSMDFEKHDTCRIEDLDDRGLVVSLSSRKLLYFPRQG